jgi:hypothetical protein
LNSLFRREKDEAEGEHNIGKEEGCVFKKELERKVEERRNKFMVLIYWEVVRNFLA